METVSDGTNSAEYVYLANSSLITNIVFKHSGSNVMLTSKIYDNLNRLQSISSALSATSVVVSSHAYVYNSANQRIKATMQDGSYWEYAYDSLGQVTNAVKKWSDDGLVAGQQFNYAYDNIGNRTTAKSGGTSAGTGLRSSTYTANSLNQYTERTEPGSFDVIGSAATNATVTVNNLATYRKGAYFWKELSVTNTSTAVYTNVSVVGVKNNAGTNQEDAVTTVLGDEFVPKTPETYTYDDDGNLTGDGRWTYTWDAENRLKAVESLTNSPTASKRKVEWSFDPQGRKIQQTSYDGSSGSYVVDNDLKLVSDGWQTLTDLNASNNAVLRSYVWGLDLSGSQTGAGGVGGLLLMNSTTNGCHVVAMDGNGNVTTLFNAGDGTLSARYEYSPFGATLRVTGLMATENPYRFSTKRTDDSTGFVAYEYRTYDPSNGRWLSRDPMQEFSFASTVGILKETWYSDVSPYLYVDGNPVTNVDYLGLLNWSTFRYLRESPIHHYNQEWCEFEVETDRGNKVVLLLAKKVAYRNTDKGQWCHGVTLFGEHSFTLGANYLLQILNDEFTDISALPVQQWQSNDVVLSGAIGTLPWHSGRLIRQGAQFKVYSKDHLGPPQITPGNQFPGYGTMTARYRGGIISVPPEVWFTVYHVCCWDYSL